MMPFDCASLSLNGCEPPPPTVGGSPLTSGGQAAFCSAGGLSAACGDAASVPAMLTNAATINGVMRKIKFLRTRDGALRQRLGQGERSAPAAVLGTRGVW